MPHFNNPIPRTGLPKFHESSTQRSLRDSDSTGRQWHRNAKTSAQEASNTRTIQLMQQTISKLRRRIVGGGGTIASTPSPTTSNTCHRYIVLCMFGSFMGCHEVSASGIAAVSAAVHSGGSGYTPHSGTVLLTVDGGTFTTATVINATINSSGVITGAAIQTAGSYSTVPSNPVSVTGGNTTATFDITWTEQQLWNATVNAGGTGYTVGDELTIVGGTHSVVATVTVVSISGGGSTGPVTGVVVHCPGKYSVLPTNPVSVTGGTGSSCTLNLAFVSPMIYIAKVPALRSVHVSPFTWSKVIESATVNFAWSTRIYNVDGQRVASQSGAPDQLEIVVPIWEIAGTADLSDGDTTYIWADEPTGGVGFDTNGDPVTDPYGNTITLLDQNRDARYWEQIG